MNNFTTELITSLAKGESIEECFRVELENAVNHLLETELTVFLDYEKHDPIGYNSGDSRNGSYKRSIDSKYGALNIKMPRDRLGEFLSKTVLPYKRRNDDLETTIIQLYSKVTKTFEIADLIEKMLYLSTQFGFTKQLKIGLLKPKIWHYITARFFCFNQAIVSSIR